MIWLVLEFLHAGSLVAGCRDSLTMILIVEPCKQSQVSGRFIMFNLYRLCCSDCHSIYNCSLAVVSFDIDGCIILGAYWQSIFERPRLFCWHYLKFCLENALLPLLYFNGDVLDIGEVSNFWSSSLPLVLSFTGSYPPSFVRYPVPTHVDPSSSLVRYYSHFRA